MNKRVIFALMRKDIKSTFSSKRIWLSMLITSLLLCTIIPSVIGYLGTHTDFFLQDAKEFEIATTKFIEAFPESKSKEILMELPNLGFQFTFFMINFMLSPLFLMSAIINSMVTASNSFAGEKERKTLENVLFTPITMKELFIGKVFASLIPTVIVSFGTYILSVLVVNIITFPKIEHLLLVNTTWLTMIFWVMPILVLFNILINVLISSKVKTFQEAQQFGSLLALPMVGIIVSQSTGLFFLSPMVLLFIGLGLLLGNLLLLKIVTKFTDRNSLFESQIH